jgi:MinD superfamily P-loop ATPase
MKIAITSGKGGTGKTTISTALFHVMTKYLKYDVQLLDCDVEEPDCHIFIKGSQTAEFSVNINIPVIDAQKCSFCGKCKEICAFNAIVMLPPAGFIEVIEDMCHACGACDYVCSDNAITSNLNKIGQISYFDYFQKDEFIEGRMKVGSSLQTRVIRDTISHCSNECIVLFDSPPGTSCPVVATVSAADYVIMVTEPTPFGLYDLKLMVKTVRQLNKKHGVVINKSGLQFDELYEYLYEEKIPVLAEIPFKKEYAGAYSVGEILPEFDTDLIKIYKKIINQILYEEAA